MVVGQTPPPFFFFFYIFKYQYLAHQDEISWYIVVSIFWHTPTKQKRRKHKLCTTWFKLNTGTMVQYLFNTSTEQTKCTMSSFSSPGNVCRSKSVKAKSGENGGGFRSADNQWFREPCFPLSSPVNWPVCCRAAEEQFVLHNRCTQLDLSQNVHTKEKYLRRNLCLRGCRWGLNKAECWRLMLVFLIYQGHKLLAVIFNSCTNMPMHISIQKSLKLHRNSALPPYKKPPFAWH